MSKKVFAIATGIMVGMAAIAGGIYVGVSMTKVDQGEVGVVYTMKEGVQKETLNPGYHWVGPFAKVKDYPVAQQQLVLSNNAADFNEKKLEKDTHVDAPRRRRHGENEHDRKLQFYPGAGNKSI